MDHTAVFYEEFSQNYLYMYDRSLYDFLFLSGAYNMGIVIRKKYYEEFNFNNNTGI